jgi:arabinofuranan 3-O-arabinosyltransferase
VTWLWRGRHIAACVVLTVLALLQAPGSVVIDTKVDLAVNPVGWLERSLHLWSSSSSFGVVGQQAYGYFWPMGPFFAAGTAVGIPGWAVQRLWWALIMCVAYGGVVLLASRLQIGTPTARLIAGVAFALSPRVLTQLGMSSIEAWPSAVAPWVLIPLVPLAAGGPIRRAVALSGLAVACAGGVNATAVLAVLPLPLLWLARLQPARRRIRAIAGWGAAVTAATAWWVVPLLVLGRYSPPFLDYIETADTTTRITDLVTVTRGASWWVAYLVGPYGPALPAGWQLAMDRTVVIATVVVAAVGIAGLARAGMPYRRILVICLVGGLGLVGLGHATALGGPLGELLSGATREFLDGAGAPLRNVHKFDVLIRLPLALGMAHLLGTLIRTARVPSWRTRGRRRALAAGLLTGAAIVAVASPALAGAVAPPNGFQRVPDYWHEAAAWLDERQGLDRVLVVPAARFPHYDWGSATDEITQPLLSGDWAVRNAIPLTPSTTIRLLDAVESVLASGNGSAGLADLLARSGVTYVIVRSDLDYGASEAARPIAVRQALDRSPGFTHVASFGPTTGTVMDAQGRYVDHGLDVPVPALEILRVDRTVASAAAFDLDDLTTLVGGPESLLDLAAAGALPAAPTVLAGDLDPDGTVAGVRPGGPTIVTDGLRRREVTFAAVHDNASATLTNAEAVDSPGPAHDYLPEWGEEWLTTARYLGIASVTASSSSAAAGVAGGSRPEHLPFAALDGDPATSWWSAPAADAAGQWLEVRMEQPYIAKDVTIHFDVSTGVVPTKVSVITDNGRATVDVFGADVTVSLPGPSPTLSLRVTVEAASTAGRGSIAISELEIPFIAAARTLVTPVPPSGGAPDLIVLSAASTTPSCFFTDAVVRCAPDAVRGSEDGSGLDRLVTLPAAGTYTPRIWARPRAGPTTDGVLDELVRAANPSSAPSIAASSTAVEDPAGRAGAAIDGDQQTVWSPDGRDEQPRLRLTWPTEQVIDGIRVSLPEGYPAPGPGLVRVLADDEVREGSLDSSGVLSFDPAIQTDELTIVFMAGPSATSVDPYTRDEVRVPVAVGELTVLSGSVRIPVDPATTVDLPCGSGPTLTAGARTIESRISVSAADLLQLREVEAFPCLPDDTAVVLPSRGQRIVAAAGSVAAPTRVSLTATAYTDRVDTTPARAIPVSVLSWQDNERTVELPPGEGARVLVVKENVNVGWQATVDGVTLKPITVDGWQQGWVVPAGVSGEIHLTFLPDRAYRVGLFGGLGAAAAVALLALLPARRRGVHTLAAVRDRDAKRRAHGRWVALGVGIATLVVVGGEWGALVAASGIIMVIYGWPLPDLGGHDPRVRTLRRWLRRVQAYLPPLALLAGGWLTVTTPDRFGSAWPQFAGLVMVTVLWLTAIGQPVRNRAARRPARWRYLTTPADLRGPGGTPWLPRSRRSHHRAGVSTLDSALEIPEQRS